MKIPKYLQNPCASVHELYGMRRAIKVLEIEADRYKKLKCLTQFDALMSVAAALKASIDKESPVAESVTLKWDAE